MKILKYMDLFGIHFHFYIGNKRKLYTSYGGIISLICIFCCVLIFFILTFKEISHKNPISNMSSISQAGYHKVTFKDEKIWIPWRIIDFEKKFINYSHALYPTIYIKQGEKDNIENRFIFKTQIINYTLCNETDFASRAKNHFIDVALNELYCIEFDNIELGGGWNADFLNYLQLDIYTYNDGIEYVKNTWAFEYFYPIVEYQPTNYENPILVIYKNHFYNLSSQLNKDERMYVQEYVLNDDKGLVFNDDKNSSFWGYFSSDFDILYSNDDLLNEKHSSKLYSLSVYLDSGKILYTRRFNKIYTVIANVFPLFNFVFFVFDSFSYMIKTIMTEKYLSELFFQRINENDKITIDKDKRKSAGFFYHNLNISKNDSMFKKSVYKTNKENNRVYNDRGKKSNNNNSDFSSKSSDNNNNNEENNKNNFDYSNKSNKSNKVVKKIKKLNKENISKNSSNDTNTNKSNLEKFNNKFKKLMTNRNNPNPNNNNNNSSLYPFNSPKHNNFIDINLKNTNSGKNDSIKKTHKEISNNNKKISNNNIINTPYNNNEKNDEIDDDSLENRNNYSHFNFYKNRGLNNSAIITRFRLKGSLFKMKDYIYSFFIKAVRKDYKYLSKEFTAIFNFLSDIYDISSYLQLYRQFHILSGFLLDNVANIDLNHKININNKELFEQIALKNKNIFYFALKERFNQISNK